MAVAKKSPKLLSRSNRNKNKESSPHERRDGFHENLEKRLKHQRKSTKSLKIKLDQLITIDPLTDKQADFFRLYNSGEGFLFLLGSPGTGKTMIAMYKALEEVLSNGNPYDKVVVIRSTVPVRDVGFLPGTLEEKSEVYEAPYQEICSLLLDRSDAWTRLKEQKHVEFITTTAMRGITLDKSIIIVDECQNYSWAEISTIMSRVGLHSKIIFCGDKFQNDLVVKKNDKSGLDKFLRISSRMPEYRDLYFTSDDIVRSGLVKSFIKACEELGVVP